MDGLEMPDDADYIELDQLQVWPPRAICMLLEHSRAEALLCMPPAWRRPWLHLLPHFLVIQCVHAALPAVCHPDQAPALYCCEALSTGCSPFCCMAAARGAADSRAPHFCCAAAVAARMFRCSS